MADDKITLGISLDQESIRREAGQAGSVIGQELSAAINKAVSSALTGHVMGSGMAPTLSMGGLPGPGSFGKDNISSVVTILQQIHATLVTGFGIAQGGGGGVPGAGAGGVGTPGGGGQPTPPPARQGRGGPDVGGAFRTADRVFPMQPFANMQAGGYYGTDVANFAASATSSIPILGQFTGMLSDALKDRDRFLMSSLQIWRQGGDAARAGYRETVQSNTGREFMQQYGLPLEEITRLQALQTSYGGTSVAGLMSLGKLEGTTGLGEQGAGLMRSLVRGGGKTGDEQKLFADTIAIAISQKLDQGRWAESFTAMAKAAEAITTGEVDRQKLLDLQDFVGNMGDRFRGDTAANAGGVNMMQGLATGQGGGLAQVMALRAAGMGQAGMGFSKAWMRMQMGLAEGGVKLEDLQGQYRQLVDKYVQSGSEDDLANAALLLSQALPAYKPTDIIGMLKALRARKSPAGATAAAQAILGQDLPGPEGEYLRSVARKSVRNVGLSAAGAIDASSARDELKRLDDQVEAAPGIMKDVVRATQAGRRQELQDEISREEAKTRVMRGVSTIQSSVSAAGGSVGAGGAGASAGPLLPGSEGLAAATAGVPAEFLRSWISIESGGNIQSRDRGVGLEDWRGARGFGQITREEARSIGITSDADFRRLSTDPNFSMAMTAKLVKSKVTAARQFAQRHNLNFSQSDMLHLTKFEHGGPGYMNETFGGFERTMGRAPTSWSELYQTMHNVVQGQTSRALENANKIQVEVVDRTGGGVMARAKMAGQGTRQLVSKRSR